ncbi:signal peptide containing protein [Cryptosporidium canis]|uniref:Signal peptide containing protein n=1 Tax=Cryptosporidium canis TaxID=195482 RepID=A0A9D5HW87_9CRYT|nr:signal peptide containing protein [Cryptosporidium canis]
MGFNYVLVCLLALATCIAIFNVNELQLTWSEPVSFLQAVPKKNGKSGGQSRKSSRRTGQSNPSGTGQGPSGRRRFGVVGSAGRPDDVSLPETAPYSPPEPDYGGPFQSGLGSSRRSRTSERNGIPPTHHLPEPDYDTKGATGGSDEDRGSRRSVRKRLSRNKGFNAANLIAHQAAAKALVSHGGGAPASVSARQRSVDRLVTTMLSLDYDFYDETVFTNVQMSPETPYNMINECQEAFTNLLTLVSEFNMKVQRIKTVQDNVRHCNCGTNNCARCQDNMDIFDSNRKDHNDLSDELISLIGFVNKHCVTGTENMYESDEQRRNTRDLYNKLYDTIMRKNRGVVTGLLLRCDAIKLIRKLTKKRTTCKKCKKDHETCKKHKKLQKELEELENARTANKMEVDGHLGWASKNIGLLPPYLIAELEKTEHDDEKYLISQLIVKECMKTLSLTSLESSRMQNIYKASLDASTSMTGKRGKKTQKKSQPTGRTDTQSSSTGTGGFGTVSSRSSTRKTKSEKPRQKGPFDTTLRVVYKKDLSGSTLIWLPAKGTTSKHRSSVRSHSGAVGSRTSTHKKKGKHRPEISKGPTPEASGMLVRPPQTPIPDPSTGAIPKTTRRGLGYTEFQTEDTRGGDTSVTRSRHGPDFGGTFGTRGRQTPGIEGGVQGPRDDSPYGTRGRHTSGARSRRGPEHESPYDTRGRQTPGARGGQSTGRKGPYI